MKKYGSRGTVKDPAPARGADVRMTLALTGAEAQEGGWRSLWPEHRDEPEVVRFSPGVSAGEEIRVHGKGEDGPDGGPPGDLVLVLQVEGRGADREITLDLTRAEAEAGCRKTVRVEDRREQISVPPNSLDGAPLLLHGRGGAGKYGGPAGDLRVLLCIPGKDLRHDLFVTEDEAAHGCRKHVTLPEDGREREITLPPGLTERLEVRLRGEGEAGTNGGKPGDLLATVCIQVRGADRHAEAFLTAAEARRMTTRTVEVGSRRVRVSIPPGAEQAKAVGEGDPGKNGGPAGDLLVTVRVRGDDIEQVVLLDPDEARSGCRRTVQIGERSVEVEIEPGARKVRLPGGGEPGQNGGPAGDLIVRVKAPREPVTLRLTPSRAVPAIVLPLVAVTGISVFGFNQWQGEHRRREARKAAYQSARRGVLEAAARAARMVLEDQGAEAAAAARQAIDTGTPLVKPGDVELSRSLALAHTLVGHDLIARDQWKESADEIQDQIENKALVLDPQLSLALAARGRILAHEADFDAALKDCKDAVRAAREDTSPLAPTFEALAHESLGVVYLQSKQFEAAEKELKQTIGLAGGYAPARWSLISAYEGQGRFREALAENRQARKLDPDRVKEAAAVEVRLKRGLALALVDDACGRLRRGEAQAAIARLHEALKSYNVPQAHLGLAAAYARSGDAQKAAEEYGRTLELEDTHREQAAEYAAAHRRLGGIRRDSGDYPGAIRDFERAVELDGTLAGTLKNEIASAHLSQSEALARQFDYEGSQREIEAAIRAGASPAEAYGRVGASHLRRGRFVEAMATLEKAVSEKGSGSILARAYSDLAATCLKLGDNQRAKWAGQEAVRRAPGLAPARESLAAAYLNLGSYNDAVGEFQQALRLRSGDAALRARLADAYRLLGNTQETTRSYDAARSSYDSAIRVYERALRSARDADSLKTEMQAHLQETKQKRDALPAPAPSVTPASTSP